MTLFFRLFQPIRYQKGQYGFGVFLSILSAASFIYTPVIGKQLIDFITTQVQTQQVIPASYIYQKFLLFMGITLFSAVTEYFSFLLLARASNAISKQLRDDAHEHIQRLPIAYFDHQPAGKISARIVNDTELLRNQFYLTFSNQFLTNFLLVVGIYLAILLIQPLIGMALLCLIPLFILWQWIYVRLAAPINQRWRESVSELNNQTAEIIHGVSIVQLFHQEQAFIETFEKHNQTWLKTRLQSIRLDGLLSWDFSTLIKDLVMFFILLYIGIHSTNAPLVFSTGTIFILINYITRLFDPILVLVRLLPTLQQALAAGQRVFELLDERPENDSATPFVISEGQITFEDVTFGYQSEHPILKKLSFSVQPGETIGLVGHTGSGKSSIIHLLFRFYDPQQGRIVIDGQSIIQYNRESIRAKMGIVLQDPYLFSGTIASNIRMNDSSITDEAITQALISVGGQAILEKFPKGIHEAVVENGLGLSSGERQLIAFARTLVNDPKILILDEATSHIDTETEETIQHAMDVLKKGRTTIIVAHRLSTIQAANQIFVLENGEIKEQGTHYSLLERNGHYAEMYHLQAEI